MKEEEQEGARIKRNTHVRIVKYHLAVEHRHHLFALSIHDPRTQATEALRPTDTRHYAPTARSPYICCYNHGSEEVNQANKSFGLIERRTRIPQAKPHDRTTTTNARQPIMHPIYVLRCVCMFTIAAKK